MTGFVLGLMFSWIFSLGLYLLIAPNILMDTRYYFGSVSCALVFFGALIVIFKP